MEPMRSSDDEVDLDLLAAFIDGRLSRRERERAIRMLTESEAAFEVYAEALRTQTDLGEPKVVPITASRTQRLRTWLPVASLAAAAILMIVLLPRVRANNGEPALSVAAVALVSPVTQRPDLRVALGQDWDRREWSVTRGGTTALIDSMRAFRLGIRTVDLQVALAMNDRQVADRLTAEMVAWLGEEQFAQPVAASYADLEKRMAADSAARLVSDASQAEKALGELLDSFWFEFGKWCGSAELAARTHAGAFFQSDTTARFIREALAGGRLEGEDAVALRQLADLAKHGVAGGTFDTVRDRLQTLIKRHAG
jgi:hypothetical protein